VADGGEHEQRADAGTITASYERLRAAVLSGGAGGWRLGHGVLSAHGIVGWMHALGELAPLAPAARAAEGAPAAGCGSCAPPPAGPPVSLPDADQVVAVLAQMVLPLAA